MEFGGKRTTIAVHSLQRLVARGLPRRAFVKSSPERAAFRAPQMKPGAAASSRGSASKQTCCAPAARDPCHTYASERAAHAGVLALVNLPGAWFQGCIAGGKRERESTWAQAPLGSTAGPEFGSEDAVRAGVTTAPLLDIHSQRCHERQSGANTQYCQDHSPLGNTAFVILLTPAAARACSASQGAGPRAAAASNHRPRPQGAGRAAARARLNRFGRSKRETRRPFFAWRLDCQALLTQQQRYHRPRRSAPLPAARRRTAVSGHARSSVISSRESGHPNRWCSPSSSTASALGGAPPLPGPPTRAGGCARAAAGVRGPRPRARRLRCRGAHRCLGPQSAPAAARRRRRRTGGGRATPARAPAKG